MAQRRRIRPPEWHADERSEAHEETEGADGSWRPARTPDRTDSPVEALEVLAAGVSALAGALERLTARLEAVCASIPMPKPRQDAEEAEVVVGAPQEVIKPH